MTQSYALPDGVSIESWVEDHKQELLELLDPGTTPERFEEIKPVEHDAPYVNELTEQDWSILREALFALAEAHFPGLYPRDEFLSFMIGLSVRQDGNSAKLKHFNGKDLALINPSLPKDFFDELYRNDERDDHFTPYAVCRYNQAFPFLLVEPGMASSWLVMLHFMFANVTNERSFLATGGSVPDELRTSQRDAVFYVKSVFTTPWISENLFALTQAKTPSEELAAVAGFSPRTRAYPRSNSQSILRMIRLMVQGHPIPKVNFFNIMSNYFLYVYVENKYEPTPVAYLADLARTVKLTRAIFGFGEIEPWVLPKFGLEESDLAIPELPPPSPPRVPRRVSAKKGAT